MKISFLGLGKLGLPCAEAIAQKGHTVKGYDIRAVASKQIQVMTSIKDCLIGQDIVFVAVPTPHENLYDGSKPICNLSPKDFSYSAVKSTLTDLAIAIK